MQFDFLCVRTQSFFSFPCFPTRPPPRAPPNHPLWGLRWRLFNEHSETRLLSGASEALPSAA